MAASSCVMCDYSQWTFLAENDLAVALRHKDSTLLHSIAIPRRHVVDYFDTTEDERHAMHDLLEKIRSDILKADPSVEGFNIGVNCGEMAGQTVMHCHMHLIPRRKGDHPEQRGVRAMFPCGAH